VKQTFVICAEPHPSRRRAMQAVADAPEGYCVTVAEPNRNLSQNAAQWPILQAFADQLQWPVNGTMETLTPDEWKDILTAAFRRETVRVAMGLDGGMVMLGARTSKFSKREFSDWLEFLMATAAQRGVDVGVAA
jgi:NinB protein